MGIQFLDQLKSPLRLTHEFQLLSTSEKLSFYFSLLLSQDKLIGLYGNIKCNMTSEVFFKFIVLCDLKLESSRWTLWVVSSFTLKFAKWYMHLNAEFKLHFLLFLIHQQQKIKQIYSSMNTWSNPTCICVTGLLFQYVIIHCQLFAFLDPKQQCNIKESYNID